MSKGTTIKDALGLWEKKHECKASESKEIKLYAQYPPIEKMDASLSTLTNCEKLSLSTNSIEKIANLNGLRNIKILSLGRNNIKNLNGLQIKGNLEGEFSSLSEVIQGTLVVREWPCTKCDNRLTLSSEAVADTLEELWISYNNIEKLKGIGVLKKLKVLYMSNNQVKAWDEFQKLAELPLLEDLLFVGNPLEEKHSSEGNWRDEATKRLPRLKKLDGVPVVRQEEEEEEEG